MGYFHYAVLILGLVVVQGAAAQTKDSDKALQRIFADWKHRQGLLKAARYVITGTMEYKYEALPPGNPIRPRRSVLLLDFERKRLRLETSKDTIEEFPNGERIYRRRISTEAFDGKEGRALTHKKANGIDQNDVPDMTIGRGEVAGTTFQAHLWPVLFAHGLVPTVHTDIQIEKKLPPAYRAEDFDVRGQQFLDEEEYTVVRTEPKAGRPPIFDELWIDPNQKSAIRRYVYFSGSKPWMVFDVQWRKKAFGSWPQEWTTTWYKGGSVRRVNRLKIQTFEANPAVADSDFTLPVQPGMKVAVTDWPKLGSGLDPRYPPTRTYLISPSGSWQEISAKGPKTLDGKVLPPGRTSLWIYGVGAGGVGLGALAFLRFRKVRG